MAKLQFATLSNLQEFLNLHNVQIDSKISEAVRSSIKTVSQSEDGYTLYFYTRTAPVTIDEAAFTITLPQPTGKADKVKGAVNGHLAGLDANGNLVDSGKAITDFDEAGAADSAVPGPDGHQQGRDRCGRLRPAGRSGRHEVHQAPGHERPGVGAHRPGQPRLHPGGQRDPRPIGGDHPVPAEGQRRVVHQQHQQDGRRGHDRHGHSVPRTVLRDQ